LIEVSVEIIVLIIAVISSTVAITKFLHDFKAKMSLLEKRVNDLEHNPIFTVIKQYQEKDLINKMDKILKDDEK